MDIRSRLRILVRYAGGIAAQLVYVAVLALVAFLLVLLVQAVSP